MVCKLPIFRVDKKNVYFVHVPKCGGTTVEQSLVASGFSLSFLDLNFSMKDMNRWYNSTPQHVPEKYRRTLFSDDFFDYEFALVRDPVARFLSAFNHRRRTIGRTVSLDSFLKRLVRRVNSFDDYFGYKFDNHFLPASRFLSERQKSTILKTAFIDAYLI